MRRSKRLLGAAFAVAVGGLTQAAMAQNEMKGGEIKIGEINSYSLLPAFTEPYRKGWQLAVDDQCRRRYQRQETRRHFQG
jgi:branched-chain amino acid transport system substrate-binding protein